MIVDAGVSSSFSTGVENVLSSGCSQWYEKSMSPKSLTLRSAAPEADTQPS